MATIMATPAIPLTTLPTIAPVWLWWVGAGEGEGDGEVAFAPGVVVGVTAGFTHSKSRMPCKILCCIFNPRKVGCDPALMSSQTRQSTSLFPYFSHCIS